GLGWATVNALHLEEAQRQAAADLAWAEQVRLALWRLDSRVAPALAREDSRPYHDFMALHVPVPALTNELTLWQARAVWMPSPLLSAEMPDWMLLHFQAEEDGYWRSPQVVPVEWAERLKRPPLHLSLTNVTPERSQLLEGLKRHYQFPDLMARLKAHGEG